MIWVVWLALGVAVGLAIARGTSSWWVTAPVEQPAPKPSPRPRVPITRSFDAGRRVELYKELTELQRRIVRARQLLERRYSDAFARQVLRVLDGDPHELKGRRASVAVSALDRPGVDSQPGIHTGTGAGGGAVPEGVRGETDPGGGDGVPGQVGSVATWPYTRPGGAEHDVAGGLTA